MISTGTIKIKFVDHQSLTNGGVWIYSVVDAVTPDGEKPSWHTIKQFYDGERPNPKRINETYHIRIEKSKREMFKDSKGEWIDKGEFFIITEAGWATEPFPDTSLINYPERAFVTLSDVVFDIVCDDLYIYDGIDYISAQWPSGALKIEVIRPYALKRFTGFQALAFGAVAVLV